MMRERQTSRTFDEAADEVWRRIPHGSVLAPNLDSSRQGLLVQNLCRRIERESRARGYSFDLVEIVASGTGDKEFLGALAGILLSSRPLRSLDGLEIANDARQVFRVLAKTADLVDSEGLPRRLIVAIRDADHGFPHFGPDVFSLLRSASNTILRYLVLCDDLHAVQSTFAGEQAYGSAFLNIFATVWFPKGKQAIETRSSVDRAHESPAKESSVVFPLHGIRTQARWQGRFADVAQTAGWKCRLAAWYFGRFSLLQFLSPWSREAKVRWFRETYRREVQLGGLSAKDLEYPSIVAHSFGTYILGNALLKYEYLRFDKVLLCGSILPTDFPWPELIDRGQVQAVRNEYGVRDVWAGCVSWFIPRTGPSGTAGFKRRHLRIEQERFHYDHSEYFEEGHMEANWLPFLEGKHRPIRPSEVSLPAQHWTFPVGAVAVYLIVLILLASSLVGVPFDWRFWKGSGPSGSQSPAEKVVSKVLPVRAWTRHAP